ncbi:MAG: succinate dehydrogenase/fumarate reductase iron-sulfur subunit [Alphaproteobacteria bacterium]|nr:succinate dehydrogenase/fumarate reductase iron-sulfur subunit [Alphaproteobacteria bacterium]
MSADAGETLTARIWRSGPGRFQDFRVPRRANQTVLDVVTWIQRRLDPTLGYRFACRVGMCGSCAMTVNGVPRWTCRTRVERAAPGGEALEIAPLRNLPPIKDLAVDMTPLFERWQKALGRFVPPVEQGNDFVVVPPATPARRAADAGIECIGCGVCHAACDLAAADVEYLGPAALNRAWTLVNDARDGAQLARIAAVAAAGGAFACHSHQNCQAHCPKGLNPTAAISGLKRMAALGSRP